MLFDSLGKVVDLMAMAMLSQRLHRMNGAHLGGSRVPRRGKQSGFSSIRTTRTNLWIESWRMFMYLCVSVRVIEVILKNPVGNLERFSETRRLKIISKF